MTDDPRIKNIQHYSDYLDQANDVLHQLIVASSSKPFFNLRVPNPIVHFKHEPVIQIGSSLVPGHLCQAVKEHIWFILSSEDDWQLFFEVLFSFLDFKSKHDVVIKIFMKELTPETKQRLQELLRSQVLRKEYRDAPDEALFWVFKSHLTAYMLLHCYGLVTPSSLICFLRSYGRCFRSVLPNWLRKSIPFVLPELSWLIFNQRIDTAPNTIKKLLQQTLNDGKLAAQTFEQVLDSQRPYGTRLRDFLKAFGLTSAVHFLRQHFRHMEVSQHFDFVLAAQVLTLLPRHYWPKTAIDIDIFLQDVCYCSLKSQLLSATRIAIVVLLKMKAGVTLQNALLMMTQNLLLISKCYSHFDAVELENKLLAHSKTVHKEQLSFKGYLEDYAGYNLSNGIVTHGTLSGFGLELQHLTIRGMRSTALQLQNCLVSRIPNAATGLYAYFELLDLANTCEKYIVEISIGFGSDGQNALLTELKDAANEDRYSRSLIFRLKALIASRYEFLPLEDIHDELRAALFNSEAAKVKCFNSRNIV